MRTFFPRYKWVVFGVILILVLIPMVLFIIKPTPTNTSLEKNLSTKNITPTPILITEKLCDPFPVIKDQIPCREAVRRATADTKGKIKNITVGDFPLNSASEKIPDILKKKMWLIEIDLEKPLVASNGATIKSLQIAIPVDATNALFRIPVKL